MCLIISLILMIFGINLLLEGDLWMGIGSMVASLFFITLMVRHFLRVKKERGTLSAKDCLQCNQQTMNLDDKETK